MKCLDTRNILYINAQGCHRGGSQGKNCHGFMIMIDVVVVVVVVSSTSSCKEVGPKWRRVFRLISCVTVGVC